MESPSKTTLSTGEDVDHLETAVDASHSNDTENVGSDGMPADQSADGNEESDDVPKWKQKLWGWVDMAGDAVYKRMWSYYWLHLAGWILISLVWSGFVTASAVSQDMRYIDALFYSVSAVSATGLETRNLAAENLSTKILLFFAMMISGAVFESSIPVLHRLHQLRKLKRQPNMTSHTLQTLKREICTAVILYSIIWTYWLFIQLISFIAIGFWTQFSSQGSAVMERNGISAWWWTLFQVVSTFNNCGFGLIYNNMVQFNQQILVLIFGGAMVLMGNTAFPVFLRASMALIEKVTAKRFPRISQTIRFLLDNPRAHMTHLFPKAQTWWLVATLFLFNFTQTILMIALDHGTAAFAGLGSGYTVANALFQSISVRTAGLNSINIAELNTESQVFMILMMYVSAFPVTILLRSTNDSENENERKKLVDSNETVYQLSRLLVNDLVWIVIAWYLICAVDGFSNPADGFSVLFEVVSAYGTVGLSLGVSCCPYSFSGSFSVTAKLIIIVAMLLGRHRGMPDNIDSAIKLEYDETVRFEVTRRASTVFSRVSTVSRRSTAGFQTSQPAH